MMTESSNIKYKMVCLDMDGTLLNNKHEISPTSATVLTSLSERGVIVAIATGRSSASVIKYITGSLSMLKQPIFPMVVFNGSVCLIKDQSSQQTKKLFSNSLTKDALRELCRVTTEKNLVLQFYNGETGEVFVNPQPGNEEHLQLINRYAGLVGKHQTVVERTDSEFAGYDGIVASGVLPVKVLIMTPEVEVDKVVGIELSVDLHRIRGSPFPFFVEFLMPNNNKGTAVQTLCNHLGIDVEDTIAFGDGENDAEMLEVAGLGVAMANGRPKAKSFANEVTEYSNDEDGVARYLAKLFNL